MKTKQQMLAMVAAAAMLTCTACSNAATSSAASQSSAAPSGNAPASSTVSSSAPAADAGEREMLTISTVFYNPRTYNLKPDNVLDHVMEEKVQVKLEYTEVSKAEFQDRVVLLYASGDHPEIILNNTEEVAKILGNDGLLLPLNQRFDAIPNYYTVWSDEEEM